MCQIILKNKFLFIKFPHFFHAFDSSAADTESVIDGYGVFNKEESFDRRDSRAITLVHKYAASFTKHYETMDRLNHDVEEIMDRFNAILDFIHQQLQQRASELAIFLRLHGT